MPLDVITPSRMPSDATESITRREAAFEPNAELRKLTASLDTPTTIPRIASRPSVIRINVYISDSIMFRCFE